MADHRAGLNTGVEDANNVPTNITIPDGGIGNVYSLELNSGAPLVFVYRPFRSQQRRRFRRTSAVCRRLGDAGGRRAAQAQERSKRNIVSCRANLVSSIRFDETSRRSAARLPFHGRCASPLASLRAGCERDADAVSPDCRGDVQGHPRQRGRSSRQRLSRDREAARFALDQCGRA